MTLVLQTNIAGHLHVWLVDQRRLLLTRQRSVAWHGSDQALAFVVRTLRTAKVSGPRIKSIIIVRGPGPFTAVRTGIIIAQTLGLIWGIPVMGVIRKKLLRPKDVIACSEQRLRIGQRPIRPWYGKQPNITRSRR